MMVNFLLGRQGGYTKYIAGPRTNTGVEKMVLVQGVANVVNKALVYRKKLPTFEISRNFRQQNVG